MANDSKNKAIHAKMGDKKKKLTDQDKEDFATERMLKRLKETSKGRRITHSILG